MFYTSIDIKKSSHKIDYNSTILSIGSCFSENIGVKLQKTHFNIDINPFGVLFNPVSIKQSIEFLMEKQFFKAHNLIKTGSMWGSFAHSTHFSDMNMNDCLLKINSRIQHASEMLRHANTLILTFGIAWIYTYIPDNTIVANCHKFPSSSFNRRRISSNEIVTQYNNLIDKLLQLNPNLQIIFTVSPVRHIKDGATENNISKGILLQAVQELVQMHSNSQYFPSYEIMLDELRDYRFYAPDMLHPSDTAIEYIFNKFRDVYFNKETNAIYEEINQYNSQVNHRPLHPESNEFQLFKQKLNERGEILKRKYPFMIDKPNQKS